DKGQDLLRLIVGQDNKIIDVEPSITKVFVGSIFPPEKNKIGKNAVLLTITEHPDYIEEKTSTLHYKVVDIKE
ncbi:hypothetical protein, partial [Rodentibacter caecimuris]|uniref:hypothetical protein n=1 Tax=Rodentibacter caecimuris TaxID=1796644 RepID=UPI0012FF9849